MNKNKQQIKVHNRDILSSHKCIPIFTLPSTQYNFSTCTRQKNTIQKGIQKINYQMIKDKAKEKDKMMK